MSEPTATQNAPLDQVQPAAPVIATHEEPVVTESAKDKVAAAPATVVEVDNLVTVPEPVPETRQEPLVSDEAPKVEMANVSTTPVVPPVEQVSAASPVAEPVTAGAGPVPTPAPISEEKKEVAEDREPQNTLTGRFTEVEWSALKELRAQLPDIFAEAFPDKPEAKSTPVTIWGVPIDPTKPKSEARVSVVLMKFLRARALNVTAAREMLVGTLRWRESFNIEAALKEEFPSDLFGNMGVIYGHDKGNRPVVYNLYGANPDLKSVFSDVQRFLRWRVALQERSVALLDFNEVDQTLQIHDYAGVSLSSRDANSKAAASESTNIFGAHYPELLYKKFFINVPSWMTWIFWAFKAIIPSATLAKMAVVGSSTSALKSALLPHIDAKELPKRYGGEADAF